MTGKTLLRNELLAKVLEEFEVLYEQFVSAESLKNLKAEYESRLANKDNRVNVLAPSGAWQGICLGIKRTAHSLYSAKMEKSRKSLRERYL